MAEIIGASLDDLDNWGSMDALDAFGTLDELDNLNLFEASSAVSLAVTQSTAAVCLKSVSASFGAASGGTTSNSGAIEFAAATGSWGSVSHFGLFDASSSGNLLIHGAFSAAKTIASGDILRIAAGDLDVTAA